MIGSQGETRRDNPQHAPQQEGTLVDTGNRVRAGMEAEMTRARYAPAGALGSGAIHRLRADDKGASVERL